MSDLHELWAPTRATTTFTVMWAIEVDAYSPEDAAALAQHIQRDPESLATVFSVCEKGGHRVLSIDTAKDSP